MQTITLLSDWGMKDPYLASVKGAIVSQIPEATLIDLSHEITPYDVTEASFILRQAYGNFPKGTIHLIGINTTASLETPHLVVKHAGQYFIGADNGIFNLLLENEEPEEIVELEIIQETPFFTFSTRDVFIKAALHLSQGKPMHTLGRSKTAINQRHSFLPVIEPNNLKGKVIYIDRYENLVTNISIKKFQEVGQGNPFRIDLRKRKYTLTNLHTSYTDVEEGMPVALFGSHGLLEIAICMGNASSLLGIYIDDMVRIEFLKNV
ncbi:MAG: hypothetical protein CSA95_03790 [Bacteroidetes bacterium]|nr:MAG: hypothetical protein CSA95_03790 [Bacteroidota bacterium]PIE88005.1 MAG: hypothetical protein CSA04_04070 [Bacteroidota bacterium]